MDQAIIKRIASEASLPEATATAALVLLEEGATASFIARYRREVSGGLDEAKVRVLQERWIRYKELEERRNQLLKLLEEEGKATDDLCGRIRDCWEWVEIEDLHQRCRPKRKTRAVEATEKGLEPLAEYIWGQEPDAWSLDEHLDVFIDPEKGVADRQQALRGAIEIIADWIADSFELRKALREQLWNEGFVVSAVVPAKAGLKTKYSMYYDRREPVISIPSHRVLAIRRGTKEGVLTSSIQGDSTKALQLIAECVIRDPESPFVPVMELAIRDCYSRILRPLIETEVRAKLKERADSEAIRVFQENLENLLLSPPCGPIRVLGVEAGKGEEVRLVAVNEHGHFLEEAAVSRNEPEGLKTALLELIPKHDIRAVAIGGGPRGRETETAVRGILADEKTLDVMVAGINDAGIAVYASSRIGREELPDLSVAARTAISAARRLQDPLAEMVKIDPKLIGVGQYQHDVDQKELHRRLVLTVQSCATRVGTDLNTASYALLRFISGISDRMARRIVSHRSANGPFPSRAALLSVPGMDDKTFRQAAGFLRVSEGENVLDRSWIHPDHYPLVEKMAASLEISVADLIENEAKVSSLNLQDFVSEDEGMPTLLQIRDELLMPGRDPRGTYAPPRIRTDVRDIADLKEGMILEGTVTNVTNFGAFVDVGILQDGLVHLSQMSNRFIRDPREAVKVGDLVQVKVISVEVETKRIGLSMKALLPPLPRRRRKPRKQDAQPAVAETTSSSSGGPVAESDAAAAAQAMGTNPARTSRRARSGNQRRRRRPPSPRKEEFHQASPPEEEKPKVPEPSLQEKIAILQSKFRGIS